MPKSYPGECTICGCELNNPEVPESQDCGGDCVKCMADALDPDCIKKMVDLGHEEYECLMK